MFKIILLFFVLIAAICLSQSNFPVIGIYTQDAFQNKTFISCGTVSFLQMAGAQIVPIYYSLPKDSLLQLLNQVNGIVFPGGPDYKINSTWMDNAITIFQYAIEQNKNSNPFPILGICLGHQVLGFITSNYDQNVLRTVHGEQYMINSIQIKQRNSLIFKNWQQKHFKAAEEGIYIFDHNWAIYKEYFDKNKYLQEFWNVVSTTTSSQNEEFISAWQAKSYPIYSIQFHPESTLFNWDYEQQKKDIIVSSIQLISNGFTEITKLNKNRFLNQEYLYKNLIYNFKCIDLEEKYAMPRVYLIDQNSRIRKT